MGSVVRSHLGSGPTPAVVGRSLITGCLLLMAAVLGAVACGDDTSGAAGYEYGGESPGTGTYEDSRPTGEDGIAKTSR